MPVTQTSRRRVIRGWLLILALIVLAATIFLLDDIVRAFERRTTIVALLPDAPDLVPGAAVWIAGERVGRVRTIEFLPSTAGEAERVALTLEVPARLIPHITRDSYARITSARLIGEPVVDIVVASGTPIVPEDTLAGRLPLDRAALMARAAVVRDRFDELAASFDALGELPALRDDGIGRLQRRFSAIAREMAAVRRSAAAGSLGLLLSDPMTGQRIDRFAGTIARLEATLDTTRERRADQVADLRSTFGEVVADAHALARDLERLRAASTRGTLYRLSTDSALVVGIRRLQAQLDSLVQDARSNPFRFVF